MGLKNTNYKINGYEYPEVYAVFNGEIRKLGNDYVVAFNVHGTRELALKEQPLEVKKVRLTDWDRKSDIVAYAYQKGKELVETIDYDYENGKEKTVMRNGVFTGWQDDIL
jgi:hypothetical protein